MSETSTTLLAALCDRQDELAWQRLLDIYGPMIRGRLARYGVSGADADDLVQNVLTVVFRRLPEFERQRTGSFRAWLRQITVNCLRDAGRKAQRAPLATGTSGMAELLAGLADPHSDLSRQWDREHDRHVTHYLLGMIEADFKPGTFQAFRRLVLDGADAKTVAAELGGTVNAVLIAKSRVLRRLREVGENLIE